MSNFQNIQKVSLNLIVWPCGIIWLGMCFIGLFVFAGGGLRSFSHFGIMLISPLGIFSLLNLFQAAKNFPTVSLQNLIGISLGVLGISFGAYLVTPSSPILFYSALMLALCAIFIIINCAKKHITSYSNGR